MIIMIDIDDLIKYESECGYLDFKTIQYTKEQHHELIKDVISFANSDVSDEKYIICGVRFDKNHTKIFDGITPSEIFDSARYQQLIRENIEPDMEIEYFSHIFNGNHFAILKISGCNEKPYMVKKDSKYLNKGEMWIRKGSHKDKMTRLDIQRIMDTNIKSKSFLGDVKILFSDNNSKKLIIKKVAIKLYSKNEKEKIQKIIDQRQSPESSQPIIGYNSLLRKATPFDEALGSNNYNTKRY